MAACFTHVASVALQVDIDDTFITGHPDNCPAFLAALLHIGACIPSDMRIPQQKAFLTRPQMDDISLKMYDLLPDMQPPTVMRDLPLLGQHVIYIEPASDSEDASDSLESWFGPFTFLHSSPGGGNTFLMEAIPMAVHVRDIDTASAFEDGSA